MRAGVGTPVVARADQRATAAGAAGDEPGKEIACSSGAHGPHERSDRRSAGTRTEAKTEDRGHCGQRETGKRGAERALARSRFHNIRSATVGRRPTTSVFRPVACGLNSEAPERGKVFAYLQPMPDIPRN